MKRSYDSRSPNRIYLALLTLAGATAGCGLLAGLGDAPVVTPEAPSDSGAPEHDSTLGAATLADSAAPDGDSVALLDAADARESGVVGAASGRIAVGRDIVYVAPRGVTYSWSTFTDDNYLHALHRRDPAASTRTPGLVLSDDGGAFVADELSGTLFHVCARRNGYVYCWGDTQFVLLGGSLPSPSTTPVLASGDVPLDGVLQVAAGGYFSCARRAHNVMCWGGAANGVYAELSQLDDAGATSERAVPIPGLAETRTLAVGHHHACAVVEPNGSVVCWGRNDLGQSGTSPDAGKECLQGPCISPPRLVPGLTDVRQLALGVHHSCALTSTREVWCWGGDIGYSLGASIVTQTCVARDPGVDASSAPCSPMPVRVPLDGVDSIAVGEDMACAIKDGKVYCWGGSNGSLGIGPTQNGPTAAPTVVRTAAAEITRMREVAIGETAGCAIGAADDVYCWGYGPLGLADAGDTQSYAVRVTF